MSTPHHISRRQFLTGAAGVGALGVAGATLGRGPLTSLLTHSASPDTATLAPGKATLVLLTLYGGNDGLNTVIPYTDSAYLSQRGALAYQPNEVIPVADGLAFHPNLVGFKQLWDARNLAVIRGVGYPNPSFSHFQSMDIWQSANPTSSDSTGWLGRWLDATGSDPMRALSVGPNLPLAFTGAKTQAAAITAGSVQLAGSSAQRDGLATMVSISAGEPALVAQVAQSGQDMLHVQHTIVDLLGADGLKNLTSPRRRTAPTPTSGNSQVPTSSVPALRPASSAASTTPLGSDSAGVTASSKAGPHAGVLGAQLDLVGRLIKAGCPSRVYGVSLGSFDTHANEKVDQAQLLAEVDSAVTSFVNGLKGDPRGQDTVVLAYSEFGRRVAANASGGTDHGSAAPVFVAGPKVKGGFYGDEPSLVKLSDGNLVFTTDFRSVYASVLANIVGEDPKVSLGRSFATINFV